MAYRVPKLRDPQSDWEPYALEVLEGVLDGHDGARLTASLVRGSRIATAAGAGYSGIGRGPGFFLLSGAPAQGRTIDELEQGLRSELARIAQDGIELSELRRVKAQVIAAQVYSRDSMFAQAREIGALESIGLSQRVIDIRLEKLSAVTAEQVQEVARKYFGSDQLTVAILDPQPLANAAASKAPSGLRH
jgi:zinc protease